MDRLLAIARGIDRLNGWVGRVARWLTLAMVLVGAFNAVARYTDPLTGWGLSSNAYIEGQWYLFSLVFLLGAAYTLRS
jgi:TRAP-type mannitol/chloroaromatic compound transport system permease small subunit